MIKINDGISFNYITLHLMQRPNPLYGGKYLYRMPVLLYADLHGKHLIYGHMNEYLQRVQLDNDYSMKSGKGQNKR